MRSVVFLLAVLVCGCKSLEQSKWESTVNTGTRIYIDRPNAIEAIDFSASLKREW